MVNFYQISKIPTILKIFLASVFSVALVFTPQIAEGAAVPPYSMATPEKLTSPCRPPLQCVREVGEHRGWQNNRNCLGMVDQFLPSGLLSLTSNSNALEPRMCKNEQASKDSEKSSTEFALSNINEA